MLQLSIILVRASLTLCSALCPRNMTLSGFKDSVMELVHFVGRLASVGLQLEGCHSLFLSFVLDFYDTVNELMLIIESACLTRYYVYFKDPLHSEVCFAYCCFT